MTHKTRVLQTDDLEQLKSSLVQLARLSLAGREQDTTLYLQRLSRKFRNSEPALADALVDMLREAPTRSSPLRRNSSGPLPVDTESRLALIRVEDPPLTNDIPILPDSILLALQVLIDERLRTQELVKASLAPTRTALFVGPPGVGKTMAARWIATSLNLPLLLLDLSAVMSSLLGRTGVNLRHVLDFAKEHDCVLLIDELDSIGKRRNDDADVGELKRLVNVLLQQIDDWPTLGSLLLGATNHPELLDPAIWRRFETLVEFPLPDIKARLAAVNRFTRGFVSKETENLLAQSFEGLSFSGIETAIQRAQRASTLGYGTLEEAIAKVCSEQLHHLKPNLRRKLAVSFVKDLGLSQRHVHNLTGVSRDTLRKSLQTSK